MKIWTIDGMSKAGMGIIALVLLPISVASQAPAGGNDSGQGVLLSVGLSATSAQIVREIDDPHSGQCWVLLRDQVHPEGPGRLVPAATQHLSSAARSVSTAPDRLVPLPVIRAGDRVLVEEHSAVADARLEAVALGPAKAGSLLAVRLTTGGRVVRAVAVAAGRAVLAAEGRP